MDRMRYIEPARRDEILADAAERATPIVVTARPGRDWITHKTHFLSSPGRQHLLIAAPLLTEAGTPTELSHGEQIGVSFRRGHKKCMFGTVVEDLQEYPQAIIVGWPEQVQELQRRVYHRSSPPRGVTVDIRYWPAESCAASGSTAPPDACDGTLLDLSVGGIRIAPIGRRAHRPGTTFVCHFSHKRGAPPLMVEAILRHCQLEPDGTESLGFQFVGLEATPTGRKRLVRLARIVSEYQRSDYHPDRRGHRERPVPSG